VHSVVFSTREPNSVAEAARHGEILLLATPWRAAQQALESAGDLSGKVLIDATNPLLPDLSGLEIGTNTSAGEQVAAWARGAKVVKAFNTVGFNIMADPNLGGERALLFYCGDDDSAKRTVHNLATELGFDAQDAGPLRQARLLEPLAMLWISLAFTGGYGRDFAFRLIRKSSST
jgi:predicted dinucleotide-binding enzyme